MDAFESVIAAILTRRGYWTQTCLKVVLTKAEKVQIGRPSSPRWELDVVGYQGSTNELLIVECKSYLDSPGVQCATFLGNNKDNERYFKLFFDDTLRKVVLARLCTQLTEEGFCAPGVKVRLALAAGKVRGDEEALKAHFEKRGWGWIGPSTIREELEQLRDSGYENSVAAVVTKILLRGRG